MNTGGITSQREKFIRKKAAELLRKLWGMREDLKLGTDDPDAFIRIAPVPIAQSLYKFQVIPCHEIPSDNLLFDLGGVIDRHARQILVAKKFGLEYERFTLAHEIGHLVLHPGRVYHRDRPMNAGPASVRLPLIEREANLFAAELLMPTKRLVDVFYRYFGGRIGPDDINEDFCFKLSLATGENITPTYFRRLDVIDRAKYLADATFFGGSMFQSLHERFRVSITAMAIQLRDLFLVF